jgi:hypothetical protein
MARSSAFCAVATFFVAAAWVFVKVATGFRAPRFTLFLAAGFFRTIAISISNLAAILSSAVTNSESISAREFLNTSGVARVKFSEKIAVADI